jgi:site-specific DNA-cytosine methylase
MNTLSDRLTICDDKIGTTMEAAFIKGLINIIEDERIESNLLLERPGYTELIDVAKSYQYRKFIESEKSMSGKVTAFLNNLFRMIRYPEGIEDKVLEEYLKGGEVDIIIGGPPCQSFSTVGQRKYDDRAKLSNEYLRVLEKVKPKMFLFENVKGILSMREIFYETDENGETRYREVVKHRGDKKFIKKEPIVDHYGDKVMDVLEREFLRIGYNIKYKVMVASKFGVPQNRERVFIIGIRNYWSIYAY